MATLPVVTGVQAWRSALRVFGRSIGAPVFARWQRGRADGVGQRHTGTSARGVRHRSRSPARAHAVERIERWLPMFVLVWMAGVALLALRLAGGWLLGPAHEVARRRAGRARRCRRSSRRLARRLHICADGDAAAVARGRRADGDRLAEARRAAARERPRRPLAAAGRSDPRARARARPPSRLPREPAADAARDAALLSPGGVVALAADPHRTRELLRRPRRQPVRRSGGLRTRACRSRGAARPDDALAMAANGGVAARSRSPAARRPRRPTPVAAPPGSPPPAPLC